MKKTVCQKNACTGCKACIDKCKVHAIRIEDELDVLNAVIDTEKCVECNACYETCPNNHPIDLKKPIMWYQGWSDSIENRKNSSSGAIGAELTKAFIENGGIVCSCTLENGEFLFKAADTQDAAKGFRGSKYVKSNPEGIYKTVLSYLKTDKSVLFIGLPCQVAAVTNFIDEKWKKNLYTVDLICHGTPSAELLKMYLEQYSVDLKKVKNITFRAKNKFYMCVDGQAVIQVPEAMDRYMMTFLESVNYTQNCYSCRYASEKRGGDLTIGDSWGSELGSDEIEKGISLILCQTEKGKELLRQVKFHFEKVDLSTAVENNRQLKSPVPVSPKRAIFFKEIKKGRAYNLAVAKIYPEFCIKQDIKNVIYKLTRILNGRS